jgi:hypothetical protein
MDQRSDTERGGGGAKTATSEFGYTTLPAPQYREIVLRFSGTSDTSCRSILVLP